MAKVNFTGRAASIIGPAIQLAPVAPDNDADLPQGVARGLFVGGGGDVVVMDSLGGVATLASQDGQYHPVMIRRVLATGTNATGIVALY